MVSYGLNPGAGEVSTGTRETTTPDKRTYTYNEQGERVLKKKEYDNRIEHYNPQTGELEKIERKLSGKQKKAKKLGLLGESFYRVTPADLRKYGGRKAAIEAMKAQGRGTSFKTTFSRAPKYIKQRSGGTVSPLSERRDVGQSFREKTQEVEKGKPTAKLYGAIGGQAGFVPVGDTPAERKASIERAKAVIATQGYGALDRVKHRPTKGKTDRTVKPARLTDRLTGTGLGFSHMSRRRKTKKKTRSKRDYATVSDLRAINKGTYINTQGAGGVTRDTIQRIGDLNLLTQGKQPTKQVRRKGTWKPPTPILTTVTGLTGALSGPAAEYEKLQQKYNPLYKSFLDLSPEFQEKADERKKTLRSLGGIGRKYASKGLSIYKPTKTAERGSKYTQGLFNRRRLRDIYTIQKSQGITTPRIQRKKKKLSQQTRKHRARKRTAVDQYTQAISRTEKQIQRLQRAKEGTSFEITTGRIASPGNTQQMSKKQAIAYYQNRLNQLKKDKKNLQESKMSVGLGSRETRSFLEKLGFSRPITQAAYRETTPKQAQDYLSKLGLSQKAQKARAKVLREEQATREKYAGLSSAATAGTTLLETAGLGYAATGGKAAISGGRLVAETLNAAAWGYGGQKTTEYALDKGLSRGTAQALGTAAGLGGFLGTSRLIGRGFHRYGRSKLPKNVKTKSDIDNLNTQIIGGVKGKKPILGRYRYTSSIKHPGGGQVYAGTARSYTTNLAKGSRRLDATYSSVYGDKTMSIAQRTRNPVKGVQNMLNRYLYRMPEKTHQNIYGLRWTSKTRKKPYTIRAYEGRSAVLPRNQLKGFKLRTSGESVSKPFLKYQGKQYYNTLGQSRYYDRMGTKLTSLSKQTSRLDRIYLRQARGQYGYKPTRPQVKAPRGSVKHLKPYRKTSVSTLDDLMKAGKTKPTPSAKASVRASTGQATRVKQAQGLSQQVLNRVAASQQATGQAIETTVLRQAPTTARITGRLARLTAAPSQIQGQGGLTQQVLGRRGKQAKTPAINVKTQRIKRPRSMIRPVTRAKVQRKTKGGQRGLSQLTALAKGKSMKRSPGIQQVITPFAGRQSTGSALLTTAATDTGTKQATKPAPAPKTPAMSMPTPSIAKPVLAPPWGGFPGLPAGGRRKKQGKSKGFYEFSLKHRIRLPWTKKTRKNRKRKKKTGKKRKTGKKWRKPRVIV